MQLLSALPVAHAISAIDKLIKKGPEKIQNVSGYEPLLLREDRVPARGLPRYPARSWGRMPESFSHLVTIPKPKFQKLIRLVFDCQLLGMFSWPAKAFSRPTWYKIRTKTFESTAVLTSGSKMIALLS